MENWTGSQGLHSALQEELPQYIIVIDRSILLTNPANRKNYNINYDIFQ
jgi:hypothetical protein